MIESALSALRESRDHPVVVEDLSRSFGDFVAVERVSLTVSQGEIFGFLGPNGAGKTTTIKMLTGLLSPTSGRGRVAGSDITTERAAIKERIGYMSQRFSLYPDLTVAENVRLFAGLYGVRGTRFEERRRWVLDMAELADAEERLTGSLPLGWKQRLALGCAVIHQPPILFLDEPTSGVDPLARRRFWDLIDELSAGGTTVFVSTHYMEEAEYCHRLALMSSGRLIAMDTPAALRSGMNEPILEVRTDDAPRAVQALRGAPHVVEAAMFGRTLHVVVDDEARGRRSIETHLAAAGRSVAGIERVRASLEDVFVALVRQRG